MIIDTNVYSAADNGHTGAISVVKSANSVEIPIVVLGELKAGFLGGTKNDENKRLLDRFLAERGVSVLDISYATVPNYAELAVYARRMGKSLSNNDIWIAALAREHDLPLVTFDKDFGVFAELLGDQLRIIGY